ncbi:hypothetical protein ACH40E_10740 [Streptomyces acidicola]|uniref:hypothetical protein n=1 Tax=Streptomyces acidicola TaxID=2596892 RepID=UPI0037952C9B
MPARLREGRGGQDGRDSQGSRGSQDSRDAAVVVGAVRVLASARTASSDTELGAWPLAATGPASPTA